VDTPYHLLDRTCVITPPSTSQDDAGAPSYVWTGTAQTVPCTIQPNGSDDAIEYMRQTGTRRSTVFMAPVDTTGAAVDVKHASKLVIGSTTYRVVGVHIDRAGKGVLFTLDVEEES
jgi:hypothetical protein